MGSNVDGFFYCPLRSFVFNMNLHLVIDQGMYFHGLGKSPPQSKGIHPQQTIYTFITNIKLKFLYYSIVIVSPVCGFNFTPQSQRYVKHLSMKTTCKRLVGESIKSSFSMKINQCLIMFRNGRNMLLKSCLHPRRCGIGNLILTKIYYSKTC